MNKKEDKLTFDYNGNLIDVDVIYRKRKNISIKVIPKDTIQIISPYNLSNDRLEKIINDNRRWITNKLDKFTNYNTEFMNRNYTDMELYYYLGKEYHLKISKYELIDKKDKPRNKKIDISLDNDFIEIKTDNTDKDYIRENLKLWYKLQSEKIVLERINHLREKSHLFKSIIPSSVKIKEQKTIWGSCNYKKSIYINSKISMLPIDVIDYIIIHEFCHILHMNHSKDFYLTIEKIMPDYKIAVKYLKDNNYKFTI